MDLRLAPDRHVAIIGDRVILLDVKADRYTALGKPAASILGDLAHADPDSAGVAALLGLGVIERGPFVDRRPAIPVARQSALELPALAKERLGLLPLLIGLARASLSLKWRGLAATLGSVTIPAYPTERDPHHLIGFAQAYVRMRSYLPLQHICLPDSLAMHRMLASRGLSASLVLGVRLNPFGAHCWVQADDMVLNDSCDTVSGFTPILAL